MHLRRRRRYRRRRHLLPLRRHLRKKELPNLAPLIQGGL